jgi:hypothetical protein|tara:strand:- start:688 stop:1575 length:888 start_codon:yes stop_codon:yes gene_type:complete
METNAKTFTSQANFHLAGIVPIAGSRVEHDFPFPDVMLPVANDYTLLDAAIVECAYAGCDTIWIICNDDTAPLLRHRVGDYIEDPSFYYYNTNASTDYRKRIPIFWVPQHPKDRDKRDCLAWSVIHGALCAFQIGSTISKWVIPDKYYVSFPYGVVNPREVMNHRREISSQKNFYLVSEGKTVQDNIHSSFTFGKDEWLEYRRAVRRGTGQWKGDYGNMTKLPIEERWSARFFELEDVFTNLDLEEAIILDAKTFFDVSTWAGYRNYMRSEYSEEIIKPPKDLFSYKEFNRVAPI